MKRLGQARTQNYKPESGPSPELIKSCKQARKKPESYVDTKTYAQLFFRTYFLVHNSAKLSGLLRVKKK